MARENQKNTINNRIDEELVCVDSLKHALLVSCGCKDVRIQREQDDPPDFTVIIDGNHYPTEVTSIVLEDDQQFSAQCDELAKAIHDQSISLCILSGAYALMISGSPSIPKPSSKKGRQLIEAAVAYVSATKELARAAECHLITNEPGRISIMKLSCTGSIVGAARNAPALSEDKIPKLATLIQQQVNIKQHKLKGKGIESHEAILLLYDAVTAKPKDVIAALQKVNGYDWFHSIFWAASFHDRENITYPTEPGREGFFLFSSNEEWDKIGTVGDQLRGKHLPKNQRRSL